MSYPFHTLLRTQIEVRLGEFQVAPQLGAGLRRAAVAIVLTQEEDNDQTSVLLTLRPTNLNRHGGQYALPGGRLDEGETEEEAALRELHEELGLKLDPSQILGRLDDYSTRSGFRITPVVMWSPKGLSMKPDPTEVAAVFHIPLIELDSPDIPDLRAHEAGDNPVLSAFIPSLGHDVFAPTAAILYQFREVALRGLSTRVSHYDQPAFAWK